MPKAIIVGHSAGAVTAVELFRRYVRLDARHVDRVEPAMPAKEPLEVLEY